MVHATKGGQVRKVYLIQGRSGGPVKIGSTNNVSNRLRTHQISHPDELVILCEFDERPSLNERTLHRRFADANIRGEWFTPTEEIMAFARYWSRPPKTCPCCDHPTTVRLPDTIDTAVSREGRGA